MGWVFRKSFNKGPLRTNISKRGVGFSIGPRGLRFGINPQGRLYFSIGIPGSGLYYIKYLSKGRGA